MKKILLFVVLLTSVLSSCGDEEITRDPESLGYQYFPLEKGQFWIFNVVEKKYVRNAVESTTTFQTRELIDEISKDQTGREWYRVQVSRRTTPADPWTIRGVKMVSKSNSDLRVLENNRSTVLMVFPVAEGKEWNANAFNVDYEPGNPLQQVRYTYRDLMKPFVVNGQTYGNTVTVMKANTDNIILLDQRYEVFGKAVGPLFRSSKIYNYCDEPPGSFCEVGNDYIVNGTEVVEELESTGVQN